VDLKRIVGVIAVLVAAVLVGLLLFGSKSLDVDDLEADLTSQAAPELGTTPQATEVSCPDDVDVETGTTFECQVTYDDREATIEIELTDDEGTYVPRLTR
jgi:Domain of unknown function (DUF4333)